MADILEQYNNIGNITIPKREFSKEQLLLFSCFKTCFGYKYIVKDGGSTYAYYKKPIYDEYWDGWVPRKNDIDEEQEINNYKAEALLDFIQKKECFKIP